MNVTREELAAYADGELDAARAAKLEAALAAEPELAAQVEAHRALKAGLAAHFASVLDEPLPDRLTARLAPKGDIVDLSAARARREERRMLPRWTWIAGPALAASLMLALFSPRGGVPAGYASNELAIALDSQLVASQPADAPTRILLTFRDEAGEFCRAFAGSDRSGIACRDSTGWRLLELGAGRPTGASEFRQAGSDAAVLSSAQDMAAGSALDAQEEAAARERGWR